jgi:Tol biopolymer transport system component
MFSSRRLIAWALAPLASALSIASAAELPLEPSRRVSFGVEEGTWMSLDVSPGGDRLVFDLLGDLYTLPIQGGEATRITSGTAFDTQPRYAPDGRQVVFVSDRSGHENLWTIDAAGGEPRPLTREADFQFISPAWAPDGRSLVVVKRASGGEFEAGKLWRYGLDGAGKSLVAGDDHADLNALGPWFSPSASEVYLSYRHGGFAGYNQRFPLWQVGVFDLETGELFPLTNRPGSGLRPLVSPDGRWLVYATRHDADTGLRLRDLRTGHERWLAHPVQRDNQESIASLDLMPGSAFTPDSRALITSFQGRIWRVALPSGEIEQIPFRARVDQGLGALVHADRELEDGPLQVRQIRFPRLSPDGSRLAFTALDRLWVMEMPGGEPRRLTSMQVSELQPAWSPDGTTLVYVSWSDRDGGHLYRVPADGSAEPTRLTREASFYTRPAYSPDGHHVVFVRGPRQVRVAAEEITARTTAQGLELRWLPAEGGESHFIMRAHGFGRPHFAGSSDRVFLYQGAHGLVSTRLDGSERRVHVEVNGYRYPGEEASPPAWDVLMGPGRRQAIAWDDSHVYWFALPAQAAEVPAVSLHEARESALPVRRLTTFGGEFMDWAQGGKAVSYALGRTVFTREIDAVNPRIVATTDGSLPVAIDSREKGAAYQGESVEVRLEVPRARPRGSVVLRGARLITMNGEEVIESGDVLIEDHRMASTTPRSGSCWPTWPTA